MINTHLIITLDKDLSYVQDFHGLVIHVKDTRETYYVNENLSRINITLNSLILNTELELKNIISPILSRVYIVEESAKLYRYTNRWEEVKTEKVLLDLIENSIDFAPSVLYDKGRFVAPKTLASAVYMNDGSLLSANLDSSYLTVTRSKAIYVEAEIDRQKIFTIPYPITNYDLHRNHISVFVRGNLLDTDKYVINNDKLILNSTIQPLDAGQTVLFIFYYSVILDMNDNVVLTTKHYEDLSITTEKLSPNIRINANNVVESPKRLFLTPGEREKLSGVDYGATRYIHPDTHPASMIETDPERRFITDEQLAEIDKKAYIRDVFTKQEVMEKIQEVIGSAPETLDTLRELAEALGNDPNFATTVLKKLDTKADKTEITRVDDELETKVNNTDYLKTGIYNTPVKTAILDVDEYKITIEDLKLKEYIDGLPVTIKITEYNRGPSVLKINDLEPKPILTQDLYPLLKNELKVGSIYNLRYNGTTGNFILQGKGGVNLLNTTQSEYLVDKEQIITRGDLLDLVNGKVRLSTPRCTLLSTYESNGTKFSCDDRIETIPLRDNRFVTVWKNGNILKLHTFSLSNRDLVQGNLDQADPIVFELLCKEFSVVKINDYKIVITVVNQNNLVSSTVVNIEETNEIILGEQKLFDDIYDEITNLRAIKVIKNRFIMGYQFLDKTRLMYIEVVDDSINVLSTRTNVDYLIDDYCFINEEQILFSGCVDNIIRAWVMNIDDLDFYHTTLSKIVVSTDDESYTNVSYTLVGENEIYATYTNSDSTKQYSKTLFIDFNGHISAMESKLLSDSVEDIKNNLIFNRIKIDDLYLSVSNYDIDREEIEVDNNNYIKVLVEKIESQEAITVNKYTVLSNVYSNISYTMIDKNTLIVIYNSRNNDSEDYRLFFKVIEVKRRPDMVAISNGIQDESVIVAEW